MVAGLCVSRARKRRSGASQASHCWLWMRPAGCLMIFITPSARCWRSAAGGSFCSQLRSAREAFSTGNGRRAATGGSAGRSRLTTARRSRRNGSKRSGGQSATGHSGRSICVSSLTQLIRCSAGKTSRRRLIRASSRWAGGGNGMSQAEQTASFFVGVDLGQAQDSTAVVVLQRQGSGKDALHQVVQMKRYPLGTAYPEIVKDLAKKLAMAPADTNLILDATGVGRAVVDLVRAHPGLIARSDHIH